MGADEARVIVSGETVDVDVDGDRARVVFEDYYERRKEGQV